MGWLAGRLLGRYSSQKSTDVCDHFGHKSLGVTDTHVLSNRCFFHPTNHSDLVRRLNDVCIPNARSELTNAVPFNDQWMPNEIQPKVKASQNQSHTSRDNKLLVFFFFWCVKKCKSLGVLLDETKYFFQFIFGGRNLQNVLNFIICIRSSCFFVCYLI